MVLKPLCFLLTIATLEAMLVTGDAGSQVSRQKRSDDAGAWETALEHLSQQVTALNAKVAALEAKTNTLGTTVAFSATGGSTPVNAVAHGPILISQVHLNIGDAFDHETGFFTAPVSGVYQFTVNYMAADHVKIYAEIVVDGQTAAHTNSDSRHGYYDNASMQTVVHVSAGKKVYVRNAASSPAGYYGGMYLAFSGFLLRAD